MPNYKKIAPFLNLLTFYLIINFIVRLVLLFHPITQSSFGAIEIIKIFVFGFLSDFFIFTVAAFFLWIYVILISDSKYAKPYGYIIFGLLIALLIDVRFGNTILNEYGGGLVEVVTVFIALKTFLFGLLLFLPKYRSKIRFWLFVMAVSLYVVLILQNGISEYFFWNEFGVRYNFIAVDYLVYTNEVIGNIMQSYPVVPIIIVLLIVSGIITFYILRNSKNYFNDLPALSEKLKISGIYLLLFAFSFFAIPLLSKTEKSTNVFANELQANGIYKFYLAFKNNELDYFKFYKTLPNQQAYSILAQQLPGISPENIIRKVQDNAAEAHKNVVLISIESYSADFMKMYGNDRNITPFLDSLATQSLNFTNFYAVGNRTVRGLEALTLCLPPTPGESVIKRQDNSNKFSTGNLFAQRGYTVKFLYGGDAYFDNMQEFFSGNGYSLVDKKSFAPEEITFSNVWGVCDEDMAKKAIKVMNAESQLNKPFFNHWMTVSNHRPFTYPAGRIDISNTLKSRDGGVKYTDFALRQFFHMAQKQPWFANTVFVILADHCASSSGKTELPMDKYRIPALIYSPGFIAPAHYKSLMSQIDLMPTLLGLLHFSYDTKFLGQDVMKPDYKPRALIATYANLGMVKDNILTILSPKQKVEQFQLTLIPNPNVSPEFQLQYEEKPLKELRMDLVNQTISYYQTTSDILKKKKFQK